MSFLAWLFALGGLAIAFPILFHLIRPTPKGSQRFSSLMFLRESPPRISRRSRIDHWLLLLMRALIVLLLAAAFMRPFIRTGGEIFVNDLPGNRVALLVDRSASMRRSDLWQQASDALQKALQDLQPGDDVAFMTFDRELRTVVGFSQDRVVDLESRKQLIRDQFASLRPTWYHTDLGNALAAAADMVSEVDETIRAETGLQIVLISDMQQGAELGDLQTYVWPEDVRVKIRSVAADDASNASVRVLPDATAASNLDRGRRVRLVNEPDSLIESFRVVWEDAQGQRDRETETGFYVPPGTSQLLRVPEPRTLTAERLVLLDDPCPFDNQFFVTKTSQRQVAIAWFGQDDPADVESPLYFLQRVVPESPNQIVQVDAYSPQDVTPWQDGRRPRLVVVAESVAPAVAERLRAYVAAGGLLLALVDDQETLDSMRQILPGVSPIDDPVPGRDGYVMLGTIDFRHPLFQPLASPRFNDFTNIRFWKHLPLTVADSVADPVVEESTAANRIVALFDDESVAIWQHRIGQGMAIGMSTTWRPTDSQLALSTKFVPLMTSLLGMSDRTEKVQDAYLVGDTLPLPVSEQAWSVLGPDGSATVPDGEPPGYEFSIPGIYSFRSGDQEWQVAVNLHPQESQTAAVDSASLESFDVRIGAQPSRAELAGSLQKLKDTQLESRQRIWKWLILAALCLLVLETLMAAQRQATPAPSEAAA